jgi:hypothetical protein
MVTLLYGFTLVLFLNTLYYCVLANTKDRKRTISLKPHVPILFYLCYYNTHILIRILPSHTLLISYYSLFSWLFLLILNHPSSPPPPLPSLMDSPMTCSLILEVVTLVMVLLEISTKIFVRREFAPSLMTESFKEVMK